MKLLQQLKNRLEALPPFTRNFYFLAVVVFAFIMFFLDDNNLFSQYQSYSKLKDVEDEKRFYQEKIKEVKQQHEELFGDKAALEKYAREKYLMKKPTEEIYLVEVEE